MAETTHKAPSRGWQGAVLKLLRADDYEFTVTSTEKITEHYIRLGFTGGGVLTDRPVHPTMWVRLWFESNGKAHQRGYTLADPDPATDSFFIEFAVHDGAALRWALAAKPGDTISATFMGSKFAIPEPAPAGWLVAGDPASLPAINSLLDALSASSGPQVGATIWFEYSHDDDRDLPIRLRPQDTIHWIARGADGSALVEAVRAAATAQPDHFGWVALDSVNTRVVADVFRTEFGLGKKRVKALAYWQVDAAPS
ncbi:siderophore-interacting protein [Gordonia sp. L191]|uniref:siderophore-interacting protein n=1 Tax=Gordonia TaxID=2053 RepID=UPI0024BF67DD|nr:siderophore-interacting protein [Gordonia sp. L191]WHU46212.1 siderophore-interacting protein [Gordonia sp. L191]